MARGPLGEQIALGSQRNRRSPRRDAEPRVDVGQVAVHRVLADHEPLSDLAVRQSLRYEREDLDLAPGHPPALYRTAPPAQLLRELLRLPRRADGTKLLKGFPRGERVLQA